MGQLSTPAQTPHSWAEAAEEDERVAYSAESTARNARMYDRIFGDDDGSKALPTRAAQPVPVAVEEDVAETEDDLLDQVEADRQKREEGLK